MPGRPNDAAAIAGYVRGLREAKAAFQALPAIVRENMLAATETTVRMIAGGAQARLEASPSIQTRALYNHVAWQVTKTNGRGRVGITTGETILTHLASRTTVKVKGLIIVGKSGGASGRIDKPSRRAHFIEFGTRRQPAEPFMIPAAESQKQPHLQRCVAAGKGIERDAAAIGMRTL